MPGSSIAINGWNIISGCAVALNLRSGLSTDRSTNYTRSFRPVAWSCMSLGRGAGNCLAGV